MVARDRSRRRPAVMVMEGRGFWDVCRGLRIRRSGARRRRDGGAAGPGDPREDPATRAGPGSPSEPSGAPGHRLHRRMAAPLPPPVPYRGRGGALGTVYAHPDAAVGVVLAADAPGLARRLTADLWARGYAVALPDLGWRGRPPADPEGLGDLGAARQALGAARVAFVGFGPGGLLARLAACSFPRTVAAVDFGGVLVHPVISADHPTQPMDLLPGLRCGLQYHVGGDDPMVDPLHVGDLERRLAGLDHPGQVFVYPNAGRRFYDLDHPDGDARAAAVSWSRACAFLGHLAAGL